jgi:hypothetical protein
MADCFATESPAVIFNSSLQLPNAPRWGIYSIGTPIEAFTVFASRKGQLFQHTGADLALQFENTWQASAVAWPDWALRSPAKQRAMWAAWVLPDAHLSSFEWSCSAGWGPTDIEAECHLEASARMQIPVVEVALDYIVQRSSEGRLSVKVWHCSKAQVNALAMQAKALGLQLKVVTAHSQMDDLASFFGLPQGGMPC